MRQAQADLRKLRGEMANVEGASRSSSGGGEMFAKTLDAIGSHAESAGQRLQWTGRQLTYNWTMPLVAAAGAATKWQLDSEKAMTRISKVYGDMTMDQNIKGKFSFMEGGGSGELAAIERNITALSNRFGTLRSDVANIAADWAAAGSSGVALAKATELTLKAMVLGEMEATRATEALISIQSQYGLSTDGLGRTLAQFNIIENQTGISMQGLIEGFERTAGVARNAGVDTGHLAAMLAALVPATGSAANAGNALKTIISRLLSPTKEANEILGLMGINTSDMSWKSIDASKRLEILAKKFQGLDTAVKAQVSSSIASRWQLNKFDQLMMELVKDGSFYEKSLEAIKDETLMFKAAQQELDAVLSSNPQRLKQIWVILQNATADVIQPLLPAIVTLAKVIAGLAQKFADMPPDMQKLVGAFALLLAVAGPVTQYIGSIQTLFGLLAIQASFLYKALFMPYVILGRIALLPFDIASSRLKMMLAYLLRVSKVPLGEFYSKAVAGVTAMAAGFSGAIYRMTQIGIVHLTNFAGNIGKWMMFAVVAPNAMLGIAADTLVIGWKKVLNLWNIVSITAIGQARGLFISFQTWWMAWTYAGGLIPTIHAKIMDLWYAVTITRLGNTRAAFISFKTWLITWTAASTVLSGMWRLVMIGIYAVKNTMLNSMKLLWIGFRSFLVAITVSNGIIVTLWRSIMSGLLAVVSVGLRAMQMLFVAGFKGIWKIVATFGTTVLSLLVSPWGLAIAAILGVAYLFRDQLSQLWGRVATDFNSIWSGIGGNFTGVAGFFSKFIIFLKKAFYSLPEEVQNAMLAVVRVVQKAAHAVYKLFSYLNPFAHHSPSLVENVTNGMAVVKREFGSVTSIAGPISKAYSNIKALKELTASFSDASIGAKYAEDFAAVAEHAPAAIGPFQNLIGMLPGMNRELSTLDAAVKSQESVVKSWQKSVDAATAAVERQEKVISSLKEKLESWQKIVDDAKSSINDLANAPLVGMRAMEDQIFANTQAQNKLKLEMLRMKEAGAAFDDVKDKIASINGEIENLQAEKQSLRMGGAGSEILSFYDQQIAALQAQKNVAEQQTGPLEQMQNSLKALQDQAEILDLEKALKFDGLQREIKNLADQSKELTFEEITNGIVSNQAAIAAYQPRIDELSRAIQFEEGTLKNLKATKDEVSASYDIENEKLKEVKSSYDELSSAINDVESALSGMSSAAKAVGDVGEFGKLSSSNAKDMAKALSKSKSSSKSGEKDPFKGMSPGAKNFIESQGGNFDIPGGAGTIGRELGDFDQSALIDEETKRVMNETADLMGGFDMFGPFKKKFEEFKKWMRENIQPAFGPISEGASNLFKGIDWGAPIREGGPLHGFFNDLKSGIKFVGDEAKKFGDLAVKWFGPDFKKIWEEAQAGFNDFAKAMAPVWNDLKEAMPGLGDLLKAIGAIIAVVLKLLLKLLAEALRPVLKFLGEAIAAIVKFVRGAMEVIEGIFDGDFGKVKEGIDRMGSAIGDALKALVKGAVGLIAGIGKAIWDTIADSINMAMGGKKVPHMQEMIDDTVKLFEELPGRVWNWLKKLYDDIVDWFMRIWDTLTLHSIVPDMMNDIVGLFIGLPGRIWDSLVKLYDDVTGQFQKILDWTTGIFKPGFEAVGGFFSDPIGKSKSAIDSMINGDGGIRSKFDGISKWAGEVFAPAWAPVESFMKDPVGNAKNSIEGFLNGDSGVASSMRSVKDWMVATWGPEWSAVKGFLEKPVGEGKEGIKAFLNGDTESAKAHFQSLGSWMSETWKISWSLTESFMKDPVNNARNAINTTLHGDNGVTRTFQSLQDWWSNIFKPQWDLVKSWLSTPVNNAKDSIWAFLHGDTGSIKSHFSQFENWARSVFSPMWSGVESWLKNPVERARDALNRIIADLKTSFEGLVSSIRGHFDRLPGFIKNPLVSIIRGVNHLLDGFKQVASAVGIGDKIPSPIAENVPGLKAGGTVPGNFNPAKRDNVLGIYRNVPKVRVEPGEYVMPRKQTKKYMGQLEAMRRGAWDGLPLHATGGVIGGRGRWTPPFEAAMIKASEIAGASFRVSQRGFLPDSPWSGTSHRGDAVDVVSPVNNGVVAALRSVGIAAWDRTGKGNWDPHVHGVPLPGVGTAGGSGIWQAQDYLAGGDGLGGSDNGPRGGAIGAIISNMEQAIRQGITAAGVDFANMFGGFSSPVEWIKDLGGKALSGITGAFSNSPIMSAMARFPNLILDAMAKKVEEAFASFSAVMGGGFASADEASNARMLMDAGKKLGASRQAMKIALMAAKQESSMGTDKRAMSGPDKNGDMGWFQQRVTRGDGTAEQLQDALYSLSVFLRGVDVPGHHVPGLYDIRGWEQMGLGQAAQAVQVSAYPTYYDKHASVAEKWLTDYGYYKGTLSAKPGWKWIGENGPELMRMRGGEQILSHKASIRESQRALGQTASMFFTSGMTMFTRDMQASLEPAFLSGARRIGRTIDARQQRAIDGRIATGGTQSAGVRIENATFEFPNVSNGNDAKQFVDNLEMFLTSGTRSE